MTLDAHVVMPNHVHGIVILHSSGEGEMLTNGPSLVDVVHWLKTRTTVAYGDGVRANDWPQYNGRLWQSGFMDHIIRSEKALERLRQYMENNPSQWKQDVLNTEMST